MSGVVASPTPMIGTSGDSIRVTARPGTLRRSASAAREAMFVKSRSSATTKGRSLLRIASTPMILSPARIGTPSLVVCLDSGCGNYDQLWMTTSLRGSIVGNLTVDVLTEGVHSGDASGIVPSSFRVIRILLDRLEDAKSGGILPEWLHVEVPAERLEEAKATARVLGDEIWSKFPFVEGMQPLTKEPLELLLNRTWRPALAFIDTDHAVEAGLGCGVAVEAATVRQCVTAGTRATIAMMLSVTRTCCRKDMLP